MAILPANYEFFLSEANIACCTSGQQSISKRGLYSMKRIAIALMSVLALLLAAGANYSLI